MFINENGVLLERGGKVGGVSFGANASNESYAKHGFYPLDSEQVTDYAVSDELKSYATNLVNTCYYALINAPVEYNGVQYRGGEMSLLSINGVLSRAQRDNSEPQLVRDINDNLVSLTIAELTELTELIFDTIKPIDEAMGNARVAVKNAATVGEIQAILEGL